MTAPVHHRTVDVDGIATFYRESGRPDAPVLLLPHGYPSSSLQYRHLLPALGDRWRVIAPDHPGFGHSATPADFAYTFDAYADFLARFVDVLGLDRYVIYLQDYGSQFGLRLAMSAPERVAGLIVQNGDIYPDEHGPKYAGLKELWDEPDREKVRAALTDSVTEDGFRSEFLGELPERLRDRVSPDLWTHTAAAIAREPHRRDHLVTLLADQGSTRHWFPRQQAYLRDHRPPTLIIWGPHDDFMPEGAARAYLRDLPDAELHLLDAGHWALETSLAEIVPLVREFLRRVYGPARHP